jgi:hypothetical protein
MKCTGCGITIPEAGEYPDPDAMLCDSCAEKLEDSTNLCLRPTTVENQGTTCFHYGKLVNSEKPIVGVVANNSVEWLNEEIQEGLSLAWLNHERECKLEDHDNCDITDEFADVLIGEWIKGWDGKFEPDPKGEYSALVGEIYTVVYLSKYTERHALCSPCYAGCGDIDTEGRFLCYVLPPEVMGGTKNTTNNAERQ